MMISILHGELQSLYCNILTNRCHTPRCKRCSDERTRLFSCYCERRLIDSDSHIEHLKPQTMEGVDPLDFMNMLCSCQKNIKRGEPLHCGNLKADWYEQELFITPFEPACESRFSYTGDGRIKPANDTDKAAEKTIEKLGLNIPKLRDLRKQVMDTFFEESLSEDDFSEYIAGYLQQDQKGQYSEFWTTVLYISINYN